MKLLQKYLKNKPSSQSPLGIVNHEIFFQKNRAQATSLKLQASSQQAGGWDPKGTSTRGGWAHSSQASYPQVIHRKDI
jgi:hypothetical protein